MKKWNPEMYSVTETANLYHRKSLQNMFKICGCFWCTRHNKNRKSDEGNYGRFTTGNWQWICGFL